MSRSEDQSPSLVAARYLASWLPDLQREAEDTGRQTVQHTGWLVGLATAFITFLAANERLEALAGFETAPAVTLLLLSTVVFGAGQRILYHLGEATQRQVLRAFHAEVLPILMTSTSPFEPQELLTKEWIIQELQKFFGMDYEWLRDDRIPLADAQSAYKGQYDLWKDVEDERILRLRTSLTAMLGKPKDHEEHIFDSDPAAIEGMRLKSKVTAWLLKASGISFYLASLSFVAAVATFVAYVL